MKQKKTEKSCPRLLNHVIEAVAKLEETDESTLRNISAVIQNTSRTAKPSDRRYGVQVRAALKHAVASGVLKQHRGHYELAYKPSDLDGDDTEDNFDDDFSFAANSNDAPELEQCPKSDTEILWDDDDKGEKKVVEPPASKDPKPVVEDHEDEKDEYDETTSPSGSPERRRHRSKNVATSRTQFSKLRSSSRTGTQRKNPPYMSPHKQHMNARDRRHHDRDYSRERRNVSRSYSTPEAKRARRRTNSRKMSSDDNSVNPKRKKFNGVQPDCGNPDCLCNPKEVRSTTQLKNK